MHLVATAELRILSAEWQIEAIRMEDRFAVLSYRDPEKIRRLAKASGGRLRVADKTSAYLPLRQGAVEPGQVRKELKALLQAK